MGDERGSNEAMHIREGLVVEEVDGESVILDLEGDRFYGLNEVGAVIWERLEDQGATMEELVDAVVGSFDVERQRAHADTRAFVKDLNEAGLIGGGAGDS